MQNGLYLLRRRCGAGVWRVVSEDSVYYLLQGPFPGLVFRNRVQRVCLLDDSRHPLGGMVFPAFHGLDNLTKPVVNQLARGESHVSSQKRHHFFSDASPASDGINEHALVSLFRKNPATTKHRPSQLQQLRIGPVLIQEKFRVYVIAELGRGMFFYGDAN